jgi:hypothetical protein
MSSNENNLNGGFNKLLKILAERKGIEWLGLIVAILALIDQVQPNSILGNVIGLEKNQVEVVSSVKPTKNSKSRFEYTLQEYQPQFIKKTKASLSITFQRVGSENIVKLNIAPIGEISSSYPILDGYTETFKSSRGLFNVQILNIDYKQKKVIIQVSRKK